jgi:predicted DsbA family dithiol-disulfide isomerase
MANGTGARTPDEPLTAPDESTGATTVLQWYDFVCPYCYVGQQRNTIFEKRGLEVVEIPFQALCTRISRRRREPRRYL